MPWPRARWPLICSWTTRTRRRWKAIVKAAPLGRLGEPEDIAFVVAFLAGPDGGWVNGQVLRANGGMV